MEQAPVLEGSGGQEQIAWATKIRANALASFDDHVRLMTAEDLELPPSQRDTIPQDKIDATLATTWGPGLTAHYGHERTWGGVRQALIGQTSAAWWIEHHRNMPNGRATDDGPECRGGANTWLLTGASGLLKT